MKKFTVDKFIGMLLVSFILFAIFLQISTTENTNKLKNDEIVKSEQYAEKIVRLIALRTGENLEEVLAENSIMQDELNEILEAFLTKQYSYIFMLRKDDTGHYRFVLDGDKENPAEYGSVFFPKSPLFDQAYSKGTMYIVEQHDDVEGVWVSLVYPYKEKGKTKALLVLDLSEEYAAYLNNFNSPLVNVVHIMQVFLLLALFFLLFITYRYYKTRQILIKDSLSEAYTKYYMTEYFDKNEISNHQVFLVDLDEFAEINLKYGSQFGDKLIHSFVARFQDVLGKDAKVVRIIGTEFVAFVAKSKEDIYRLSEKLFDAIAKKHYLIEDEKVALSISMSAIETPDETHSLHQVLRLLDEEMLKVKSQGKHDFRVLGLENDSMKYSDIDYIKSALEDERLVCLYQPICETQSKQIIKYEALSRLIDKDDPQKLISPFQFMHLIRGTSQYIKMTKLVLSDVFVTLEKYPQIEISMNLDLDDLYNIDMMKLINAYLLKYQKNAPRLTFEIVEENEITDYDRVMDIFNALKMYGSKIAIDDFGSGYANYQYLIALDIDILKIDGSLIRELNKNEKSAGIVLRSIKNLAETFQYDVVAEFVSDESIYLKVKDLGIGYIQGYYLGKPKPINEYLS